MKYRVTNFDLQKSNVEFVIGTCTVGHGGLSYAILTDGCGDPLVQTEYESAGPFANVAQLSYDAFRFDTGADITEDQTETITCTVFLFYLILRIDR